jgi:lysophospholipase L1-like esterase
MGSFLAVQHKAWPRPPPQTRADVVVIGDSIIANWTKLPELAPTVANVAIGGQTTRDMLGRFQADVIARYPWKVVLEGGVNDIVSMHYPAPVYTTEMAHMARAAGAKVVVLSVVPADIPYPVWEYNSRLFEMCSTYGFTYVDAFYPFLDQSNAMRPELFLSDGVHLTVAGYDVLWQVVGPHLSL